MASVAPDPGPSATADPPASVARLLDGLSGDGLPGGAAGAAVVIVLRDHGEGAEALLVEKTHREGDPASGHVALPGGRVAKVDGSMRATALRELEEEVGLTARDLLGIPRFVKVAPASAFSLSVAVFAAALAPDASEPRPVGAEEIARVFWCPSRLLGSPQRIVRTTLAGPQPVEAIVLGDHVVWGFTYRVLREFFRP